MTVEEKDPVRYEVVARLDPSDLDAVGVLVERVTEVDGVRPLSEHVSLHLRQGGDDGSRHVLAWSQGQLAAYGHLDITDAVSGSSVELAVDPDHRHSSIGNGLIHHLVNESRGGRIRLWAHGENAAAAGLAEANGFSRSRVLWQMRRSLYAALPTVNLPDGVSLRTFLPGLDDEEWVALNSRSFIDLPDQSGWTLADLRLRMAEPWFAPAGFLIAEEAPLGAPPRMVGFHWTKVHGGHDHTHQHVEDHHDEDGHHRGDDHHAHEPIGEVYVVGVDPADQGRGLGRSLTVAGLQHLRGLGLREAMLYVDSTNTAAIALYSSLGFTRWDIDVEFSR